MRLGGWMPNGTSQLPITRGYGYNVRLSPRFPRRDDHRTTASAMKIKELVEHWEETASGELTQREYRLHLPIEAAARVHALAEMYPQRNLEQVLTDLLEASLEELEASMPYVQGTRVIAEDEEGDPVYEDIGPTPRFLELTRKYCRELGGECD
jgi:hypothetical protein